MQDDKLLPTQAVTAFGFDPQTGGFTHVMIGKRRYTAAEVAHRLAHQPAPAQPRPDALVEMLRERKAAITTMLGEPQWKPSRSHIEASRNLHRDAAYALDLRRAQHRPDAGEVSFDVRKRLERVGNSGAHPGSNRNMMLTPYDANIILAALASSPEPTNDALVEAARRVCVVLWGRERPAHETPIWDQCTAIARAALATQERTADGWQDIASAPKDDSEFLAGLWWEGVWFQRITHEENPSGPHDSRGWNHRNGGFPARPTHWRPLPAPPIAAAPPRGGETA